MIEEKHKKRVAIIGGGIAGVLAAKESLDYELIPTIFESKSELLGIWSKEGYTWQNMRTNISNVHLSIESHYWHFQSDMYPTNIEYKEFLMKFVNKYNLLTYSRLSTKVINVVQESDCSFKVSFTNGSENSEYFDYVIVCSGSFQVPDVDAFKQWIDNPKVTLKIEHASQFKGAIHYKGKKVLVVGNSYSGDQISSELTNSASQVINVYRSKRLILKKYIYDSNYKKDIAALIEVSGSRTLRREMSLLDEETYFTEVGKFFGTFQTHGIPELTYEFSSNSPPKLALADNYVELVKEGMIKAEYTEILNIDKNTVFLLNGEKYDVDIVLLCTGYKKELNYLDKEILNVLQYDPRKSHCIDLDQNLVYNSKLKNIAFVGILPYYLLIQTFEMQSRVALRYLVNQEAQMQFAENVRQNSLEKRVLYTDISAYIERLAEESDTAPDLEFIKSVDPELYDFVMNGIYLCHHYGLKQKFYGTERWNRNAEIIKFINRDLRRSSTN